MNAVINLVDLGNAKIETKQYAPFPFVVDSSFALGWGFSSEWWS